MYEERDNTDKTARMLRRIRVFSFAHIVRYLITRHQSYIRNILEADLYLFILVFSQQKQKETVFVTSCLLPVAKRGLFLKSRNSLRSIPLSYAGQVHLSF